MPSDSMGFFFVWKQWQASQEHDMAMQKKMARPRVIAYGRVSSSVTRSVAFSLYSSKSSSISTTSSKWSMM